MVRIGGSTELGAHIKETDYYTPQGEFRVDKEGSPTLLNCLMYKLSYYKFGQVYTDSGMFDSFRLESYLRFLTYFYLKTNQLVMTVLETLKSAIRTLNYQNSKKRTPLSTGWFVYSK